VATIIASTITGNGAGRGQGGGIDNGGTLIIADTTISNNGNASGGGLFNGGSGTATLVNSTVSDNTAGSPFGAEVGGGIFNEGTLALTSCTLSDNQGFYTFAPEGEDPHTYGNGLLNGRFGSATLTNTLIANSLFGDCVSWGGTVAFEGISLIEDGGCDAVAEGQRVGDPKLGPLADNGGPTLTHALLSGSPAIDAGDPYFTPPPEFDRRGEGFVRVYNERIDIGSFELQPLSQPFGSITADQNWTDLCRAEMADAVVLLGAPTHNGGDPGVARMRPKEDSACPYQVRFQEWDYRARDFGDYWHKPEQIAYLGLAPGVYPMDDGSVWEVGTFEHSGTGYWKTVPFASNLPGTPALFLTMQSTNGGQAATVRARNVGSDGFEAAILEEEYLMDGHAKEQIGYLAIYHPETDASNSVEGVAVLNGAEVQYALHRAWVDHNWTSVAGIEVHLEEEQSLDDEVVHKAELVDVLTIGDQVFAQQVSSYGRDTTAIRRR
jgi:hypothetical protein